MLLTFEQAKADDLPTVLQILDDAARWLQDQGIEQWPARFGGVDDWRSARIGRYVEAGESWLVHVAGEPVATFSVSTRADPDYADGWPDGPHAALYIFRMAVLRSWAGRDLGTRILDWASSRALAAGHDWLRLDCHRRNRPLQRYYEARGFTRMNTLVRTIDDNGHPYTRGSGALYQRPAGTMFYPSITEGLDMSDRYDPDGEAAIWQQASQLVIGLKLPDEPQPGWNAALEQAARALDNESRAIRQGNGMYYRVITGQGHPGKLPEEDANAH
ncbi:GNAT family N-acetyltransferase (plasmid) [Actinoplanes sp. CA-030573]|uniref:GNAT family N-acetyltransferase n=1 Tax=Actinoplanes sp. CA-030573 TaxID=3239898 RepID=UPI003D9260D2